MENNGIKQTLGQLRHRGQLGLLKILGFYGRNLYARPVFLAACTFFAGICAFDAASQQRSSMIIGCVFCVLTALLVGVIWEGSRDESVSDQYGAGSRRCLLIGIAFFSVIALFSGCFYGAYHWNQHLERYAQLDGKSVPISVRVCQAVEHREDQLRVKVEIVGTDEIELGKALMVVRLSRATGMQDMRETAEAVEAALGYNKILNVTGRISKPPGSQNEYLFDYRRYLYSEGISAVLYVEPTAIVITGDARPFFPIGTGIAVRQRFEMICASYLPAGDAALLMAILFGNKEFLDGEAERGFERAGLLHIMAVSGLHVMILASIIVAVLRKLGCGICNARLCALIGVWSFVFLTGFSASILRAALMFTVDSVTATFRKSRDSLTSVGISAIILLAYNPLTAFDAGFLLSYGAALSIILLNRRISESINRIALPKSVKSAFSVSLAVQVGIFPLLASLFKNIALYTIPANIAASPFITLTVVFGQIFILLGLLPGPLAAVPAMAVVSVLSILQGIAKATAYLPFAMVRTGVPGAAFILYYYAMVLFAFKWRVCRPRVGGAIILSGLILLIHLFSMNKGLEAIFLDVGNSNAAYINVEEKYHILVDAGGLDGYSERDDLSERRLYEYLCGRGVRQIDLAIATHGDSDHISGFWQIFENIPVRALLISGTEDAHMDELVVLAEEKGTQIIRVREGDVLRIGSKLTVEVLAPYSTEELRIRGKLGISLNERSLVAKLIYGESRLLFCGDIGFKMEAEIISSGNKLEAQLITVPHHGSFYSSSEAFIRAVSPDFAIIGTGKNTYGHPSSDVISRYDLAGVEVWRTDLDGMIKARCDRKGNFQVAGFIQ